MRFLPVLLSTTVCLVAVVRGVSDDLAWQQDPFNRVFPEMEEILKTAATEAPQILEELLREAEAAEEAAILRAPRYPSVRGTARMVSRYEERSDLESGRSGFQPQAGLTFRQPLYHWGSLQAEDRIGRIREELTRRNTDESFRLLALEVRSRYLSLVVDRLALDVAIRRLDLAEQEWRSTRRMLERGEIEDNEALDSALALEEATLVRERRQADHDLALRSLARLTGTNRSSELRLPRSMALLEDFDWEEQFVDFLEGRSRPPFLQAADQRVLEAERRREAERSRARPNLDLVAGVLQDQVAVFDRRDIDRTIFFAGVEVNWNIFDGFASRSRRAAASSRLRLEENRRGRLENDWHYDLEYLESQLEFSKREMELADRRLDLVEASLERARADFEAGRLSAIEVARSEVLMAERRLAAGEKRAAYLMAWAELISESGRDPVVLWFARNR